MHCQSGLTLGIGVFSRISTQVVKGPGYASERNWVGVSSVAALKCRAKAL
jgi:hypothetical protein